MLKFAEDDHRHEHDHELPHQLNERFFVHANLPQNMGVPDNWNGKAKGVGTCGDSVEVYLSVRNQRIENIGCVPKGCVYTVACASAMSKLVRGKTLENVLALTPDHVAAELGGLPEDHKHCASLAVNTLGEAIDDYYQKEWGNAGIQPSLTLSVPAKGAKIHAESQVA